VVKDYCADKGIPVDEAMATIDTDFASEPQTCDEDVSDDVKERQAKAGVGKKGKMVVGLEWRSPDVRNTDCV